MKTVRMATCHKNRKHHCKGLCNSCYERERKAIKGEMSTCHPFRKNFVGGSCSVCYAQSPDRPRATCHPAKAAHSKGLCKSCAGHELSAQRAALRAPRAVTVPSCPHRERPHYAKGLCLQCYARDAYAKTHVIVPRQLRSPEERKTLARNQSRFKLYGITPQEFDDALRAQGYACKLCREPFKSTQTTHVDHDHLTGRNRGIICALCNLRSGHIEAARHELEAILTYCDTAVFIDEAMP